MPKIRKPIVTEAKVGCLFVCLFFNQVHSLRSELHDEGDIGDFWCCGEKKKNLKPYGVRCLHFKVCGVR